MPCEAALDIMTTCASPRALATMSAPSRPPAPGLFSTTIGWPSRLPKYSASVRDRMSAAPAGGKLTIQRIGFDGQGVCAAAMPGAAKGGENREATARQHGRSLKGYESQDAYCNMRAGHCHSKESRRWISILCYATRAFPTARPDQPAVDIGVKDGRIAAIGAGLGGTAKEQAQAGGRLVCSGFVETHIHLDKSCILGRCDHEKKRFPHLAMERVSAVKHTFTVEDVTERAGGTIEKCISHGATRMRTHVEVDPKVGLRGLEGVQGPDRPLSLGDRPRDLRHAAGGTDQQSRHRRAHGRRAEERRDRRRRGAELRHRPAGADPPRLRDGARVRCRHRHASRQRRLGRGARHAAGLRAHREIRLGRPGRDRACVEARHRCASRTWTRWPDAWPMPASP